MLLNSWTLVSSMDLDEDTEFGQKDLIANYMQYEETYVIMVATNQPGYEHSFGAFYEFYADYIP